MNKKGFTLIELLAVIIILGILMIIAIPSVTKYINDSRKNTYIDTAKELVGGARNVVNEGKLEMYSTETTYYIPSSCIKTENGGEAESPYGKFKQAYIGVIYNGQGYKYYWISVDESGQGVDEVVPLDKLDIDDIKSDLKESDIENTVKKTGIGNRTKILVLDDNTCSNWNEEYNADDTVSEVDGGSAIKPVQVGNKICIRAKKLHTTKCERNDSYGCRYNYSKGDTIEFGRLGTNGSNPNPGDAFDCDVNDNGVIDVDSDGNSIERFYYVSNRWIPGTSTNSFDTNYDVLIFYKNYYNGTQNDRGGAYAIVSDIVAAGYSTQYSVVNHGPLTAIKHLPKVSSGIWRDGLIKEKSRLIYSCSNSRCESLSTKVNGEEIQPNPFNYGNQIGARLLAFSEFYKACNNSNYTAYGSLKLCNFMLENTNYDTTSNPLGGMWLENPYQYSIYQSWGFSSNSVILTSLNPDTLYGIKPVIEVPKSKISY